MEPKIVRVGDIAANMMGMEDDFTGEWLPLASSYITRLTVDKATAPWLGAWARRLIPLTAI
jgi:hypothetical protein